MRLSKVKAVAGLAAATLALSACGGGDSSSTNGDGGSGTSADGVTTLELWTFQTLHGEVYETMAGKWNEENPDRQVELDVIVYPYEDMHNKLQLAANAGEGLPDIVDVEVNKFSAFVRGGASPFVDLTEAAQPYVDTIVDARLDLYSRDGQILAFPTHVGAMVAYYNEEALSEAGIDYTEIVTWDDYAEAGAQYHQETGKTFGVANTAVTFIEEFMIAQLGGQLFTDGGAGGPAVDSPEVVEAFEFSQQMLEDGAISTIPGGEPDAEEAYGLIGDGGVAALVYPAWYASRFVDYMPDLSGKIAIAAPPVFEDGIYSSIGAGGTGTAVARGTDHEELAAEFLAYAKLSQEANIAVWEVLGFDPVNMDVWTNEEVTHNPDNKFNAYFTTNLFDVLNEMSDGIGHFESFANPNLSAVENQFRTVTLTSIYEGGVPAAEALAETQRALENELGTN